MMGSLVSLEAQLAEPLRLCHNCNLDSTSNGFNCGTKFQNRQVVVTAIKP
jgi:hypothetical protein